MRERWIVLCALALLGGTLQADTYKVDAKMYAVEMSQSEPIENANGVVVQAGGLSHHMIVNKTGEVSSQWCRGAWASKGEQFLGGAGFCTSVDADGDYLWVWFRPTGPGTNDWGVISGSGKWEGATGGGTTQETKGFADQRAWEATSKGTIKRK